jgi:hypothetical protein
VRKISRDETSLLRFAQDVEDLGLIREITRIEKISKAGM